MRLFVKQECGIYEEEFFGDKIYSSRCTPKYVSMFYHSLNLNHRPTIFVDGFPSSWWSVSKKCSCDFEFASWSIFYHFINDSIFKRLNWLIWYKTYFALARFLGGGDRGMFVGKQVKFCSDIPASCNAMLSMCKVLFLCGWYIALIYQTTNTRQDNKTIPKRQKSWI